MLIMANLFQLKNLVLPVDLQAFCARQAVYIWFKGGPWADVEYLLVSLYFWASPDARYRPPAAGFEIAVS